MSVGGRARSPRRALLARVAGPLLILAIGAVIELLPTPLGITNPPALFMPVIVWAGFSSGLGSALLAAAIGWAYTTGCEDIAAPQPHPDPPELIPYPPEPMPYPE